MWRRAYSISFKTPIASITLRKKISKQDVENFTRISGDTNPIHVGDKAIVHGAFLNSLVSAAIGTKLPGPGTIVIAQTLKYPSSCYVNDEVTINIELVTTRKISEVKFTCKSGDRVVLTGDAKLLVPSKSSQHR